VGLALQGPADGRRLLARFDAGVLSAILEHMDLRLQQEDGASAGDLRQALKALGPLHNDPDQGLRFWPLVARRLSTMAPSVTLQPMASPSRDRSGGDPLSDELALLEALTHEVRTPLATIRTLIRSLLRRQELSAVVRQRLEQIDGECSEQIDRFGLIFLAAEQQRQPEGAQDPGAGDLARTDLSQSLRQLEELWRRQLERRNLRLHLSIAPDLPPVLSDPARLETMLGGLMDRFSRSLPGGSEVRISLSPAGSRLKLQLSSVGHPGPEGSAAARAGDRGRPRGERVGPVLSWNPGTGSLQLSRQATQRLFHRLGGRLTERGDTSLTVFFPVC
jgi:signal transduction histidine kinase